MMPVAMIKAVMVLMRMMLNKEEGEEIMNLEKVEGETLLLFQSTGFSFIGKNSNPDKYRSSIHLNLIQTYCDDSFHKQMRWNDPKLFSWMLSSHRNARINKKSFQSLSINNKNFAGTKTEEMSLCSSNQRPFSDPDPDPFQRAGADALYFDTKVLIRDNPGLF